MKKYVKFLFQNEIINKIKYLEEKITSDVLKSECLGNDCRIDEAQQVLNECEAMREEKRKLEMVYYQIYKMYFKEK